MPPPHMRTQENTLWILNQPVPPCSSTTVRLNLVEARNAGHTSGPKASVTAIGHHRDGDGGGGEGAPAPAHRQHQRNEQAELRLIGEAADQDAGEDRPAVELAERCADQRGGKKAVVALAEIDEHGRKSEREEEPHLLILYPSHACGCGRKKNRANRQEIENERHALPDRQRQSVGHRRQRRGEAEEKRRVMPAVELRGRAEDLLLAGELARRVERRGRLAVEHVGAGGIDVGEIGAERAAEAVVAPVRGGDQEAGAEHEGGEQNKAHQPHPLAGQPASGAQNVNKSGHPRRFSRACLTFPIPHAGSAEKAHQQA